MNPLCIYHGACDDGFAAAWVIRKALGNDVEFYPGVYQKEPPPHEGRDVIFVDFSYKRPVLNAMAAKANSVLILDHHKTAQEDLSDLLVAPSFDAWRSAAWNGRLSANVRMVAQFDMKRSGAAMAWDYFIGGSRPLFIEYIQDRDLWIKALPEGDEFTIALRSYPQDFEQWDYFVDEGHDGTFGVHRLIEEGRTIQRYYRRRVEELKASAYIATLDGHPIWIANAPYFAASEVAGELAAERGMNFGACYFEASAGRWQYSLRSRGDFDVSAVARKYGGGGHKAAAGFTVPTPAHGPVEEADKVPDKFRGSPR